MRPISYTPHIFNMTTITRRNTNSLLNRFQNRTTTNRFRISRIYHRLQQRRHMTSTTINNRNFQRTKRMTSIIRTTNNRTQNTTLLRIAMRVIFCCVRTITITRLRRAMNLNQKRQITNQIIRHTINRMRRQFIHSSLLLRNIRISTITLTNGNRSFNTIRH